MSSRTEDLELQADCLAGAWAHSLYEHGVLERGVVDEGLRTAAAVADERIERGPETWTHGSAEQRRTWFVRGFGSGDPAVCDPF
jgi:predicted metalloprotease